MKLGGKNIEKNEKNAKKRDAEGSVPLKQN